MSRNTWGCLGAFVCVVGVLVSTVTAADPAPTKVSFQMHRVGSVRSEVLCLADFNGDGKLDIAAGPNVYLAPDWKAVKVRELAGSVDENGKGYVDDFANIAIDVDRDGKPDLISCGWFSESIAWYQNTLGKEGLWPQVASDKRTNFESAERVDIDGDGKANEILPFITKPIWYECAQLPSGKYGFVAHVVSEKPMEHGGGVGDLNGDGRPDILRPNAWFEAPADPRNGQWIEHPWALGEKDGKATHTAQMLVYDVNGDGLADVVTSDAHKYGIFWYEQVRNGQEMTWKQHTIDDTWTQAHSLVLADIDGDGDLDLVTGKRFMAHNGGDPGEFEPLGVYWYELVRGPNPTWTKHVISYNEGIGSGLQLGVADLDGDGDLDVVVTGKWGGPVWFENLVK